MTRATLRPSQGRPLLRRYVADLAVIGGTLAVIVVAWLVGLWLLHGV